MGPLSPSRPAQVLTHLLLATLIVYCSGVTVSLVATAGGLVSVSLVCDGATVAGLVTPAHVTPDPLIPSLVTDGPKMLLSTPETNATAEPLAVPGEESKAAQVVEQHPSKEKAVEGEDVTFTCLLKEGDPKEAVVQWIHRGPESEHIVLEGNHTANDRFADRALLSGDLGGGDFSMTLRNVSIDDRGLYLCVLTISDGPALWGSGTKLSIRLQAVDESVGTLVGVAVAAVGVTIGLVALLLTQFRDKLTCLQK